MRSPLPTSLTSGIKIPPPQCFGHVRYRRRAHCPGLTIVIRVVAPDARRLFCRIRSAVLAACENLPLVTFSVIGVRASPSQGRGLAAARTISMVISHRSRAVAAPERLCGPWAVNEQKRLAWSSIRNADVGSDLSCLWSPARQSPSRLR